MPNCKTLLQLIVNNDKKNVAVSFKTFASKQP